MNRDHITGPGKVNGGLFISGGEDDGAIWAMGQVFYKAAFGIAVFCGFEEYVAIVSVVDYN